MLMDEKKINLFSREKHLDHMVNMLRKLTLSFGIHAFILMKMAPVPFTHQLLVMMACLLIAAVLSLASYDLYHQIDLSEEGIRSHYKNYFSQHIKFSEIKEIESLNHASSFGHLKIHLRDQKSLTIYFLDDPDFTKKEILKKMNQSPAISQAA